MAREEIGVIDFEWGQPGDRANDYKGGYGISHIQAKHPSDLKRLPEAIARGTVKPNDRGADKWEIDHDGFIVSLGQRSKGRNAVITAFYPLN